MFAFYLMVAFGVCADAATVDELVSNVSATIEPAELDEPGNSAFAEALAELWRDADGTLALDAADKIDLSVRCAEAWLAAGRSEQTVNLCELVLKNPSSSGAQRERAAMAWIAAWQVRMKQAEKPAEMTSPVDALAPYGDLGPNVAARAHSAAAERSLLLKDPAAAIAQFDEALAALKNASPADRVPIYSLRLLAMEAQGNKGEEIQTWLRKHADDPAVEQVLDSALTSGQKLVGQAAPPFKLKRLDGKEGSLTLEGFKGKPLLLDFFATWAASCESNAGAVTTFATENTGSIAVIGISLDNKDSLANIAPFIAKHAIPFPVVGEGLGWDGEVDDDFHVESIPQLILLGADGRVAAVDLVAADPQETLKNLRTAAQQLLRTGKPAAIEEAIP